MRKGLVVILVVAATASLASGASAESLYRGRGPGIRVEFRVKHGEVSFVRVRTVLRCVRDGKRARRRFGESLGGAVIQNGRFSISFETVEPGYSKEWLLSGHVHSDEITGRFWYQHQYQGRSVCQTRRYQSQPRRRVGRDSLRFWASRRPVHSRVRD